MATICLTATASPPPQHIEMAATAGVMAATTAVGLETLIGMFF
jgi:hypothetical protein